MLKKNGGCHVVITTPQGLKMDLAKSLGAGHEYVILSHQDPATQLQVLKSDNSNSFNIVIEATGNIKVLDDPIHYICWGRRLLVYSMYTDHDRVF